MLTNIDMSKFFQRLKYSSGLMLGSWWEAFTNTLEFLFNDLYQLMVRWFLDLVSYN